jgi:hypothetical protein
MNTPFAWLAELIDRAAIEFVASEISHNGNYRATLRKRCCKIYQEVRIGFPAVNPLP